MERTALSGLTLRQLKERREKEERGCELLEMEREQTAKADVEAAEAAEKEQAMEMEKAKDMEKAIEVKSAEPPTTDSREGSKGCADNIMDTDDAGADASTSGVAGAGGAASAVPAAAPAATPALVRN